MMSQTRDNDKDVPTWNGTEETWNGYLEDVEWYFYALEPKHRGLLAHRLARKLTGTARNALKGLKASEFIGIEGITKLLRILQSRVGDLPVPDLANKLDEFIFKLKRKPGESMQEWGLRSCETYRKLTVALDRVKGRPSDIVIFDTGKSDKTTEKDGEFPWPSEWDYQDESEWQWPPENPDEYDDTSSVAGSQHSTGAARTRHGKFGPRGQPNRPPPRAPSETSNKSKKSTKDDDGFGDEEGFLPTEVRGWLLLRNSGLTYTERATVIASTQGKLEFSTIFRALRQQYPPRDLPKIDEQRSRGKRGGRVHAVYGLGSDSEDESGGENGEEIDENVSLMHVDVGEDEEFSELQAMEASALQAIATGQRTLANARKAIAQAKLGRGFNPRKPLPVGFRPNRKFDRFPKSSSNHSSKSHSGSKDQGCYICGGNHGFRDCPDKNAPKRSAGSSGSAHFTFMIEPVPEFPEDKEGEKEKTEEKGKAEDGTKVPLSESESESDDNMNQDAEGEKKEKGPEALLNLIFGHNIPDYQLQIGIDRTFREVLKWVREARHTDKIAIGMKLSYRLVNLDQTLESCNIHTRRRPFDVQVVMSSVPQDPIKLKVFEGLITEGHLHSEPPMPGLIFDRGQEPDEQGLSATDYRKDKRQKATGLQPKSKSKPEGSDSQRKVELKPSEPPYPPPQVYKKPWTGPILAKRKQEEGKHKEEGRTKKNEEERPREYDQNDRHRDDIRYHSDPGRSSSSKDPHDKYKEQERGREYEDSRGKKQKNEEKKGKTSNKEGSLFEVMIIHASGQSTANMVDFNEPAWSTLHWVSSDFCDLNRGLRYPLSYVFNGVKLSAEEMILPWNKIKRPGWKGPGDVLILTANKSHAVGAVHMLEAFSVATSEPTHLALVDSGASETVGSPESIDALVNHLGKVMGRKPAVTIDASKRQKFRVANGETIEARSLVGVETPVGILQIHCLSTSHPTPLLLSVAALQKLKAAIDFEHGVMMINLNGKAKEVRLKKGEKGHYYVDFGEIGEDSEEVQKRG